MKIQKRQEIEFFGTKTGNANSIALGYATETKNFGEVAVGVMNKSTAAKDPNSPKGVCVDSDATLFSVGCGGSGERKNALEVKGDGSVLISGEDGDINVADKIKQALDTNASIELVKSAESDLQYTLMVNNESRGSINIPKDQFLKNVTYDTEAKQLVFTFVTLDEEEHVERISINDLKDVYTAGDGINIDNNVISADFSSVMTAISDEKTQRETTDNEIKSTLDAKADKDGNVSYYTYDTANGDKIKTAIKASTITGGPQNDSSTQDCLILQNGNSDGHSSKGTYIKINNADIDIVSGESIHLDSSVYIGSTAGDANNSGIVYERSSYDDQPEIHIKADYINLDCKNVYPTHVLEINGVSSPGVKFKSNDGFEFYSGITKTTVNVGEATDGIKISKESPTGTVINYLFNSTDSRLAKDMIQAHREFAEDGVTIDPTKSVIRFRIDSNNSAKLTQAKGFQVFTDLYADPEHCKDISDYTDSEKAILTNNTVQKNILDLNKNKADVSAIPTKVSQLTNDSNFVTEKYVSDNIGTFKYSTITADFNSINGLFDSDTNRVYTEGANSVYIGFTDNADIDTDAMCSVFIGNINSYNTNYNICIGNSINVNKDRSVLIGNNISSSNVDNILIGKNISSSHMNSVIIGSGMTADVSDGYIGIGYDIKENTNAIYQIAGYGNPNIYNLEETLTCDNQHKKYIYGIGGYDGTNSDAEGIKSLQEVLTDKADASAYYTKTEIDGKGYLTAHQSLDDYAKQTYVDDLKTDMGDYIDDTLKNYASIVDMQAIASTKADLVDDKLKAEQLPKLDNIAAATTTEDMITKFNALLTDLKAKGYMTADITA